jgi:hypothetical protein
MGVSQCDVHTKLPDNIDAVNLTRENGDQKVAFDATCICTRQKQKTTDAMQSCTSAAITQIGESGGVSPLSIHDYPERP